MPRKVMVKLNAHTLDKVSGVRLFGGEMLDWADLPGVPSASVIPSLLRRLPGWGLADRVLLVGPRAAALVDSLDELNRTDVVVRALPDARRLAVSSALREGITVHCGTLDAFVPDGDYDVVVVLDAPEALSSPDGEAFGHADLLTQLCAWVGPSGLLVARVDNGLSIERLFALDLRTRRADNGAWGWESSRHDPRPLYAREVPQTLAAAGFHVGMSYAAVPSEGEPSLLVTQACVETSGLRGAVTAFGAQVLADRYATTPLLADVYDIASRLFEGGEVLALAPSWLIVAGREDGRLKSADLPGLLAVEPGRASAWAARHQVLDSAGSAAWSVEMVDGGLERHERGIGRQIGRATFGPPRGEALEALLRRACQQHDVGTVRTLVQSYGQWMQSQDECVGQDPRLLAVPSNVLVHEGTHSYLDGTWSLRRPVPGDVLFVRGVRHFALRLLAAGLEHPWAPDTSPDVLTSTLASMMAVDVDQRLLQQVARLEAEIDAVLKGGDSVAESESYARNLAAGGSQFLAQSGAARGYRESLLVSLRLEQELYGRSEKVDWLEATLGARDVRLRNVERELSKVRASVSFRIGHAVTWPARAVVDGLRGALMSLLPMDLLRRAESFARRMLERSA